MNSAFFIWGILYSAVYMFANYICRLFQMDIRLVSFVVLIYLITFIYWIHRTDKADYVGIKTVNIRHSGIALMLPLLIMPVYNLIGTVNYTITVSDIVLVASAAVTEEIFFRGIIQKYFIQKDRISEIIKINAVFALYHTVNIFAGKDMHYVLWQMICAFAIGICYSVITVLYNSIIPAAIAHAVLNITGIIGNMQHEIKILWLMPAVGLNIIYAVFLLKKYKNCYKQENG